MVSRHTMIYSGNFNISRYCISMDEHHCAISIEEERFFDDCSNRKGGEFFFIMLLSS